MDDWMYEVFEALPRQGPGDARATRRALESMANLPGKPDILDVGCGVGLQTLELANLTDGTLTAVDNHQPFLDTLRANADKKNLSAEIRCVQGDMSALNFESESFDAIWSEGAIYIIGFEKGLWEWKTYLRPQGYLAVTEVSWLKQNPPGDLRKFWEEEYPAINDIDTNLRIIDACGYHLIDQFVLPESAWWEDYYKPLAEKSTLMRDNYRDDRQAQAFFDVLDTEIDMYRAYSDYYGYVFYIMQR
jgi:ubiquinone/menaquinone biosynthesis C-methylase UbiE